MAFAKKPTRELITIDLTAKENSALNDRYKSIPQILLDAFEDDKIVGYDIKYNKNIESKVLTQEDYRSRTVDRVVPPDTICEKCWGKYGWKFYHSKDSVEIMWSDSDTDFKEYLFPSDLSIIELDISKLNNKTQIHYIHIYTNPKSKNTITKEKRYVISFRYEDAQKVFKSDKRAVWHNLYNSDFKKVSFMGDIFWHNDDYVGSKNLFDELVKLSLSEEINCYRMEEKLSSDSLNSLLRHINVDSLNPWSFYLKTPNSRRLDFYIDTNWNDISTRHLISFDLEQYKLKKRNYYLPKDKILFLNLGDALLYGKYKPSQTKELKIKSDFHESKPINDLQENTLYFPVDRFLYVNDSSNYVLKQNNYEILRVLLEEILTKDLNFESKPGYAYKNFEPHIYKQSRQEVLNELQKYGIINLSDSTNWEFKNLKYLDIINFKGIIKFIPGLSEWTYNLESINFNISPINPLNDKGITIPLFDIPYDRVIDILKNDSRTNSYSNIFSDNQLLIFPSLTNEIMKSP
ncbi:hypothetical protein [Tenacibaculum finnmarkense]|uniref:hypothetical protein n=1 Tax=Tenacibaculum finnmarkense TaxID=2781243 RepID=UPI001EFBE574|nr:hypothetical protein [Tenacibaculum finnmarkense]MCG8859983.1 hypothetical protein [Tenacibaculum finnmarkense]